MAKDIVVIGASAGGIEALHVIIAGLPAGFAASLFVVLHTSPNSPGVLADILQRAGALPAFTVRRRELIQKGCVYVAAPDHHLIVEQGFVAVTRGPKENRFRPAVDPLFRSAALAYGQRVVGVILSGGLDDGSAGLWAVKQRGGTAVAQDPADAMVASMPLNAMRYVQVDHCVPAARMPALLLRLASEAAAPREATMSGDSNTEVEIAKGADPLRAGSTSLGEPSIFACPECHGVLLTLKDGTHSRFRCHTGHAYSMQALLAEYDDRVQESLANAIRALQEKALFMEHLAEHEEAGEGGLAERLRAQASSAAEQARSLRRLSMEEQPAADESAAARD